MAIAALVAFATARADREETRPVRRLALLVGANDGGAQHDRLRYAVSDAERTTRVLERLGGLSSADTVLLREPTVPVFRAALAELAARVERARASSRVEVILYYSGHSDEEGLLIGRAKLPYADLRRWLDEVGADVRVAVIDSCASGALTREKGGVAAAPFLTDISTRLTGQAILTSSAWDEAAQESDLLGGSIFTTALLAALRGAADENHDGRVTLSESYQFAFRETLARTERSRGGAQHPSWRLQLAGAGDVVLTDLRGTEASLVLPPTAAGRFFVRDARRALVVELRKEQGKELVLGLEPGVYRVLRESDGHLFEVEVEVKAGPPTELPSGAFTPVPRELTALRGEALEPLERRFVDLAIYPPVSLNGSRPALNRVQLAFIGSRTTRLLGLGLGQILLADEDVEGLTLSGLFGSAGGRFSGAQLSGLVSMAGPVDGLQVSSVFNQARGEVRGVQLSGLASMAGPMNGLQVSSLVNLAGGAVQGLQLSGLVNAAAGPVAGVQAGMLNQAEALIGAQLGLANHAARADGAQIGLVNRASRARGLQLGLVNVADEVEGVPLGLVSWVRDGEHKLLLLGGADGTAGAEVLLGSRHFHGLLRARAQRRDGRGPRTWFGYGIGVHLQHDALLFDLDGGAEHTPSASKQNLLVSARALAGWQLTRSVAVVAGPTGNGCWAEQGFDAGFHGLLPTRLGSGRGWVSFQAGVRIGP